MVTGPGNMPYINNEYGWLWLTRDGSDATHISQVAYDNPGAGS